MAEGGWNDCRRPGNGKWFVWNEGSISLFAFPYPSQPSTVLSLFLHIPSLFPHLPHTTPHTTSPCRLLRHIPFHAPCPPRSCLRSNSSLAFVSSSQVSFGSEQDLEIFSALLIRYKPQQPRHLAPAAADAGEGIVRAVDLGGHLAESQDARGTAGLLLVW